MKTKRAKITLVYRVLDPSEHTIEIIKKTGYNKNNIKWQVDRYVKKKYSKEFKLKLYKVIEHDED